MPDIFDDILVRIQAQDKTAGPTLSAINNLAKLRREYEATANAAKKASGEEARALDTLATATKARMAKVAAAQGEFAGSALSAARGVNARQELAQLDRAAQRDAARAQRLLAKQKAGIRFNPSMGGAVLGGLQSLAMGGSGMTGLGAMAGGAIGGAFGPLGGMLGAGVGQTIGSLTQSIADLGRTVIDTGSKFEQLQMRLRGLEGSNAPKVFKDLVNTSKELAMPISEVTEQYVRLSAYGLKPAMADLEALVSYTRMIGEGKNVEFLGLALSQIAAKGKVEMQELRQLAERGFPALEVLVSKMKIPLSDIGDIGKKMIPSDEVLRVFFQEMERRSKVAAEVYATTLEGKLANLKTTWEMLLAGVSPNGDVNNPLLESYKGVVDSLRSLLESQGFRSLLEDTIQGMAALLDMVNGMVNATPAQRAKGLLFGSVTMGAGAAAYYAKIGREEREAGTLLRKLGIDPSTGKPLAKRTTGGAGTAPIYGMGATPTNLYAGLAEMMQTSGMGGGAATSSVTSLIKQLERINLDVARIQNPKFLQAEQEKWRQQVASGNMSPSDFTSLLGAQARMVEEAPQLGEKLVNALLAPFQQDYMRQIETMRVEMDDSARAALDFKYSIEDLDAALQLAPDALKPLIEMAKDAAKGAYDARRTQAERQALKGMVGSLSGKLGGQLSGELEMLNVFEQVKQWMDAGINRTTAQKYLEAMASNVQPYRPTEALQYGSAAEYSARMSSQMQTSNEYLKGIYEQLRDIAERQAAELGLELPVAL